AAAVITKELVEIKISYEGMIVVEVIVSSIMTAELGEIESIETADPRRLEIVFGVFAASSNFVMSSSPSTTEERLRDDLDGEKIFGDRNIEFGGNKAKNEYGFLVSNIFASEYAKNILENLELKDRKLVNLIKACEQELRIKTKKRINEDKVKDEIIKKLKCENTLLKKRIEKLENEENNKEIEEVNQEKEAKEL
ncbi:11701_t:CDS:2, partial [Scutellospora calospora]